jgi:alpha-beta hydrolase superfamily lysophospholipase
MPELFSHLDKTARQILLLHRLLIGTSMGGAAALLFLHFLAGFLARALDA